MTYQGKPVPGGRIMFVGPSGNTATFMLREDGSFHIEDAPIGENVVTVDAESLKPELGSRYIKLPAKYLVPETTDIKFKVEAGDNTLDVKLE